MHRARRLLPVLPGTASILFVLACAVDSAVGNRIAVPVLWLLADAVLGVTALLLTARERIAAPILLSVLSTASVGSALTALASTARSRSTVHLLAAAATVILTTLMRWQLPWIPDAPFQDQWWGMALLGLTITSISAWGRYVGTHEALVASLRRQNEILLRSREAELAAAQAQERASISREMHDVLAHRLSLVAMHANALAHRSSMPDEERRETGRFITSTARSSLAELRGILSDIREEQPSAPQPDITQLADLVRDSQTPEFPIRLEMSLDDAALPAGLGRHLFRIAQEGITNARRHGAPGVIDVRVVATSGGAIALTIANTVADTACNDGQGNGLRGISERVQLCRGRLVRTVAGGRHVIEVHVPKEGSA